MIAHYPSSRIAEAMSRENLIEPCAHNMLVYDNILTLRNIFASCAAELLARNEIVLLASQYDALAHIKNAIEGKDVDVASHLSDGTLFVIDAQEGYQGADTRGTFKLAMSLILRAKKEGRSGVSWFGDMGSFFAFDKINELIDYELFCPTKYEQFLKTVCCYHHSDFDNFDSEQKDRVVQHHYKCIFVD